MRIWAPAEWGSSSCWLPGRQAKSASDSPSYTSTVPHVLGLASSAWSSHQEWIQSSDRDVKLLCYCPRHTEDPGCLWNASRQTNFIPTKVLRWWKQLCIKAMIGRRVQPLFSKRFSSSISLAVTKMQIQLRKQTETSYFGYCFVNRCTASYLTMGTWVWAGSEREHNTHRLFSGKLWAACIISISKFPWVCNISSLCCKTPGRIQVSSPLGTMGWFPLTSATNSHNHEDS